MRNSILLRAALFVAVVALAVDTFAQTGSPGGWLAPDWNKPPIGDANKKSAPRRSLVGTWGPAAGPGAGTQASGVQLKPNDGKPENQLPYTPYGLELYRSHKALEGIDAVLPGKYNDPRSRCEPVWLDSTGRPISDQARVTETFRRVDYDTLVWFETVEDPKVYTKPWETMRLPMRLQDPRTDLMEYYCSPAEQDNYNNVFGNAA